MMKPILFILTLSIFAASYGEELGKGLKQHQALLPKISPAKEKEEFRNYTETTRESVLNFYRVNHSLQTLAFVLEKKNTFLPLRKCKMSVWDAIAAIDSLVDESDPDLDLPQSYHFFQTAEALRKDGHPRWLILTGFIHDLGKILTNFGEPQWCVVGDTFPLGCKFSDKVVYPEFFKLNPDAYNPEYQTLYGIYSPNCGLDNVHFSWGHDEYLYQVMKDYLPPEGAYIIRYHSFYSAHREGAYSYLMNDYDREMARWLDLFSQYDLYSKKAEKTDIESLRPYYKELVAEFFPDELQW